MGLPSRQTALLFILCLLPFLSVAGETGAFFIQALKKAQDQQFDFQNEKAAQTLEAALSAFAREERPSLENLSKLADVYLFLALCQKNSGKTQAMQQNLNEAARLNPNLAPDERIFPPSLLEQFEQAKDRIWHQGQFASVRIDSLPPQAHVFVNGAFKGKTPLSLNRQPAGIHYLYATSGDKEAFRTLRLKSGTLSEVKLKLSKKTKNNRRPKPPKIR